MSEYANTEFPKIRASDSIPFFQGDVKFESQYIDLKKLLNSSSPSQFFGNDLESIFEFTKKVESPYIAPPPVKIYPLPESLNASPMQLWEGRVIEVNQREGVMQVLLEDKLAQAQPHSGEIELRLVSPQDRDLVRPGAIFYLTLSMRWKRGGIENAQELRFRRLPSWTKQQLLQIDSDSDVLLSKMRAAPIAE